MAATLSPAHIARNHKCCTISDRDLSVGLLQPVMDATTAETNKVITQVLRYGIRFGVRKEVAENVHFTRRAVQERMGHADVMTTLRTYAHAAPDVQDSAVRILNNL